MKNLYPKTLINKVKRIWARPRPSTSTTISHLGQPVEPAASGRLAKRLAKQAEDAPNPPPSYGSLLHNPLQPPPINVAPSLRSHRLTQQGKDRINQYLEQNYGLNITDGVNGSSIEEDQIEKIQSMPLHNLNELKKNINLYNGTFRGSNDFIEPLSSAINQTIDLKLTALTLKHPKSPEDKKMIIDAFCQRFDINLTETVTDALKQSAMIFSKETPEKFDDIADQITEHRIYGSFDYWSPVAYSNINDPFMDDKIKTTFPDVLTQKLFDQVPKDTLSKIVPTPERNHYNVTLNETSIPIPDDGVCFFSSCLLAQINPGLESIAAVGAEEPIEEDPQELKDAILLSVLPKDFKNDRLDDLKASPYFGSISAMIESGVSFDSVKDTNPQLNRFLVNIDESQFEDMTTFEEFKDPYQAPDGFTYDRDTIKETIRAQLTPDPRRDMTDFSMADFGPERLIASIKIGSGEFFNGDEASSMAEGMSGLDINAKVDQIMHNMTPNHDVRFIIHYGRNFELAKSITTGFELSLSDQEIDQLLVGNRTQIPADDEGANEKIADLLVPLTN